MLTAEKPTESVQSAHNQLREKKQEEVQQLANLTAEREAGKARIRALVQECGALRQENN